MILRITDYDDRAAVFADDITLRHRVCSVIRAFRVKIGPDRLDQFFNRRFVKDRNKIDAAKRGNQFGTFIRRHKRTAVTLQKASLAIRIYGNDENISEGLSPGEITNMPDVKQVEAIV